jgi:hypothetical protein
MPRSCAEPTRKIIQALAERLNAEQRRGPTW